MAVGALLSRQWGLAIEHVEVLESGMNSRAWLVATGLYRLVVKSVPLSDAAFGPGLEFAAQLDAAGLSTGAPVRSLAGRFVERDDDRQVAVLQYAEGQPLDGTAEDVAVIGRMLARVHEVLRCEPGDLEQWLQVVTQFDRYLDYEPWIRPAVEDTLAAVRSYAGELTWSGLHGDPAPEAFRRAPDGEIALIDWGGAMTGPLLYDVASAVLYSGEGVLAAYGRTPEIEAGWELFYRLRQAVQAAYFAWRSATDVRTGVDGNGNAKGLADARQYFER